MHFATLNYIHLIKTPDFDLAGEITMDGDGARRLQQIRALAFGPSGKRYLILFVGTMANIPRRQYL